MKVSSLILILLAGLMLACSSGKKAFQHGNYYDAVILSVKRLRQKPDHTKSKETLRRAYPMAVNRLESKAENEIASNGQFKWRNAIQAYGQINQMYEEIKHCPSCLRVISNPKNYYTQLGPLKEKAADESYKAGINALMKGTRNDAKQAYFNFLDAEAYVSGYKDVNEYISKAKDAATLKVIIEQIPVIKRYNLSGDFFQDKVEEFVHTNYPDKTFIRFFTPQEANVLDLRSADQVMHIQFDDFSVGNIVLKEKEETVTRDSVVVGQAKVNGKTIPVYNTVKAKLTTYSKEVISSGLLSMVITDARTRGILNHRKFEGNFVWGNSWARFNGDERALSKAQLVACNQREQMPPPPDDLFLQFTKPIYDQLITAVRGFYQNY